MGRGLYRLASSRGPVERLVAKSLETVATVRPLPHYDVTLASPGSVVVSLTSHPARIERCWLTVASLLRQSLAPRSVLLWLAEEEFPNRIVPARIEQLTMRGLTIRWTANTRSYKKLVPALTAFPSTPVVTADDDVFYPTHWLRDLVRASSRHQGAIVGYRGQEVRFGPDEAILPYAEWPRASNSTAPSNIVLTGVGGILYPPGALNSQVQDMGLALTLAPSADDLWFKIMALRAGTPCALVTHLSANVISQHDGANLGLHSENVHAGANDRQWQALSRHFGVHVEHHALVA